VHGKQQDTVRCTDRSCLSVCHNDFEHAMFKDVQSVPQVEDKFVSRSITGNCFACSVFYNDCTA